VNERSLVSYSDTVIPGQGWNMLLEGLNTGYCDGTFQFRPPGAFW
jgi:hypothetical protein